MKWHEKGELAKDILKALAIAGLIVIALGAAPSISQTLRLLGIKDSRDKYRFRQSVARLRKKRLVTITYENGKEVIRITEEGRKRVLAYKLDELTLKRPKRWDGLWRIVSFDIPNKRKRIRDSIHMKLRDMGFVPLQKSIFVTPYEARDEVDFLGEHFLSRKHICYIVAKSIDNERELKYKFDLD